MKVSIEIPRVRIPIELRIDEQTLCKVYPHSISSSSSILEYKVREYGTQKEYNIIFDEDDFSGYFKLVEVNRSGTRVCCITSILPLREIILTNDFSAPFILLSKKLCSFRSIDHKDVLLVFKYRNNSIKIILHSEDARLFTLHGDSVRYPVRLAFRNLNENIEIRCNPLQDIPLKKGYILQFKVEILIRI